MYCQSCGVELSDESNFCYECGSPTDSGRTSQSINNFDTGFENRWLAALIGSVVGFFAALVIGGIFMPLYVFGILLGGIVAGYIYTVDGRSGTTVGALSGLFATAPIALLLLLFAAIGFSGFALGMFSEMAPSAVGGGGFVLIGVVTLVVVVLSLITNLLFGALGGLIGRSIATAQ